MSRTSTLGPRVASIAFTASGGTTVASLTIRNLDDATKAQLRLQAARHGRSMEEEARTILREAVSGGTSIPAPI